MTVVEVEQRFIDYWRQQQQRQRDRRVQQQQRAWQDLRTIAALLQQEFGVARILVYGSLLTDQFSDCSDLDIAAAGIAKERFYEAVAAVNRCSDRTVDLKPIESLHPNFWQRIQSTGTWLDAASQSS